VTHFGLDLGGLGAGKGRWALMESPLFTGTWFKVFLDPNLLRFGTPGWMTGASWKHRLMFSIHAVDFRYNARQKNSLVWSFPEVV
jgi:hypothetical protein